MDTQCDIGTRVFLVFAHLGGVQLHVSFMGTSLISLSAPSLHELQLELIRKAEKIKTVVGLDTYWDASELLYKHLY